MNLTPWRRKGMKRPRVKCVHCGLRVAIHGGLSAEDVIDLIKANKPIPVVPHACSFELDDTIILEPHPPYPR